MLTVEIQHYSSICLKLWGVVGPNALKTGKEVNCTNEGLFDNVSVARPNDRNTPGHCTRIRLYVQKKKGVPCEY